MEQVLRSNFNSLMFFLLNLYPSFGQEHFILGNEEGVGFLVYPRQIEEGPDGNIYAFDSSDSLIKVYSPEGKYLRKIGDTGQGFLLFLLFLFNRLPVDFNT